MSNTSREIHENNTKYIILNNKGNIESNHSPEFRNNVICMSEHVTMLGVNMNTAIWHSKSRFLQLVDQHNNHAQVNCTQASTHT